MVPTYLTCLLAYATRPYQHNCPHISREKNGSFSGIPNTYKSRLTMRKTCPPSSLLPFCKFPSPEQHSYRQGLDHRRHCRFLIIIIINNIVIAITMRHPFTRTNSNGSAAETAVSYTDLPKAHRRHLNYYAHSVCVDMARISTYRTLRAVDFEKLIEGLLDLSSLTCLLAKGLRDPRSTVQSLASLEIGGAERKRHIKRAPQTRAEVEAEPWVTGRTWSISDEDDALIVVAIKAEAADANASPGMEEGRNAASLRGEDTKLWVDREKTSSGGRESGQNGNKVEQCQCRRVCHLFEIRNLLRDCVDPHTGDLPDDVQAMGMEQLAEVVGLCTMGLGSLMEAGLSTMPNEDGRRLSSFFKRWSSKATGKSKLKTVQVVRVEEVVAEADDGSIRKSGK